MITATKVSKQKIKGSDQSNVEEAGKIPLTKNVRTDLEKCIQIPKDT